MRSRTKTCTDTCNRMLTKMSATVMKEKDLVQHGKMKATDITWGGFSLKNLHKSINF